MNSAAKGEAGRKQGIDLRMQYGFFIQAFIPEGYRSIIMQQGRSSDLNLHSCGLPVKKQWLLGQK
jgi:hypothetical protein